jgi:hypothetical protein
MFTSVKNVNQTCLFHSLKANFTFCEKFANFIEFYNMNELADALTFFPTELTI